MPGSRVYVRLAVDNTGSVLPLAGKFGVDGATALELFDLARDLGLQPDWAVLPRRIAVSQGRQLGQRHQGLRRCLARSRSSAGTTCYFLDIGGGYPGRALPHRRRSPRLRTIGAAVMQAIGDYIPPTPNLMLVLEPGRGMVGESGVLVAIVVGKAQRGDQTWLYLDAGVFNGLMETYEGFPPVVELVSDRAAERPTAHLHAGGSKLR